MARNTKDLPKQEGLVVLGKNAQKSPVVRLGFSIYWQGRREDAVRLKHKGPQVGSRLLVARRQPAANIQMPRRGERKRGWINSDSERRVVGNEKSPVFRLGFSIYWRSGRDSNPRPPA